MQFCGSVHYMCTGPQKKIPNGHFTWEKDDTFSEKKITAMSSSSLTHHIKPSAWSPRK